MVFKKLQLQMVVQKLDMQPMNWAMPLVYGTNTPELIEINILRL